MLGRDDELAWLDAAWDSPDTRVLAIVGRGGEGKTSLVNAWLARLARDGWRGARRVLGWTFYSQGTSDMQGSGGASADLFFDHALRRLGQHERITSPAERGEVLARLLAEQPTLLVIDGLEPLQAGPGVEATRGCLLDPGLRVLLRQLALHNPGGLCVLNTREPVADLGPYIGQTVAQRELDRLPDAAGAELLQRLGANGTEDARRQAVAEMDGHALAIALLGTYVRAALHGDIERRGELALLHSPRGGMHARRVMASYERWFGPGPERAVLYLLGLFDRAATGAEIRALRQAPAIPGLTDALCELSGPAWQCVLSELRQSRLLAKPDHGEGRRDPDALDAHPLVREYFAERLQAEHPHAWRAGHKRLYHHLCWAAPELPATLSELRPLFLAVAHGCAAGRHREVYKAVLRARIDRRNEHFAVHKLGAFGAHLGAVAHFFDPPFARPVPALSAPDQAFLLSAAGFGLRALGRMAEARAPMQAGLDADVAREDWRNAAISANNLAELHQTLGELAQAQILAERSVAWADQSRDASERMVMRTTLADVLAQRGQAEEAARLFREADEHWYTRPLFYSLPGYRYCDLLLERCLSLAAGWIQLADLPAAERADWSCLPDTPVSLSPSASAQDLCRVRVHQVRERATRTLALAERYGGLLSRANDHLTLGRAWLVQAAYLDAHTDQPFTRARAELDLAVRGLREASYEDYLVRGLIARAAWHSARLTAYDAPGPPARRADAERDLAEAHDIAERGGMRLFLADIAYERARLALATRDLPAARAHLEDAAAQVQELGYHRRDLAIAALRRSL